MPEIISAADLTQLFIGLGVPYSVLWGESIKVNSTAYECLTEEYVRGPLVDQYLAYLSAKNWTVYDKQKRDCVKFGLRFLDFCNDLFTQSNPDPTAQAGGIGLICGLTPFADPDRARHCFAVIPVENKKLLFLETEYIAGYGRFYDLTTGTGFDQKSTGYDFTQVSLVLYP